MNSFFSSLCTASILCLGLASCHNGGGGSGGGGNVTLGSVQFQTRQQFEMGSSGLRALRAADFTGNGVLDLVVTSFSAKKLMVAVASSPANLSLKAGTTLAYNDEPGEVVSGDFDGDGDQDIACLFPGKGWIRVLRNNGQGIFKEDSKTLPVGKGAAGLLARDLNGDKKTDLALGANRGLVLRVFFSQGASFSSPKDLAGGANAEINSVTAGDWNQDGILDLAGTDLTRNEVITWLGSSKGFVGTSRKMFSTLGKGPVRIQAKDLTKDGVPDLLVTNYGSGNLSFFQGNGKGSFLAGKTLDVDGDPVYADTGDLNEDGFPDIVVTFLDRPAIGVLVAKGGGLFGEERQFGTSGIPTQCQVVDFDRDGHLDVLTSGLDTQQISWIRGLGAKGLQGSENFATGGKEPLFLVSSDFDGDGYADVAVSDRKGGVVTILKGSKFGKLEKVKEYNVGKLPGDLGKGDFNKDGKMDVVIAVSGGLRFLLNKSTSGSFAFDLFPPINQAPFKGGVGPFEIVTGRFDGDSFDDLALADYGGDQVWILKGSPQGFGFSSPYSPIALKGGPLSILSKDFNGDGKADLAVSRYKLATVSILYGDGKGGFSLGADLPVGNLPNYLRAADFNGDGRDDLVVSNLGGNELSLLLAEKNGFQKLSIKVGQGPTALMARDLNRDGLADILVTNADSSDFFVLLGDGKGGFKASRFPGTYKAASADLGDVDGDGLGDLILSSLFTTRVSLYLNKSK